MRKMFEAKRKKINKPGTVKDFSNEKYKHSFLSFFVQVNYF